MDHLPYPTNPAHSPLSVPNQVNPEAVIDCRELSPVDCWRQDAGRHGPCSLRRMTRCLQKWLYFGLISSCTGEKVAVQRLSSEGVLSSKDVPRLLLDGLEVVQSEETKAILQAVEPELRAFSVKFLGGSSSPHNEQKIASRIILSIRILTDMIWRSHRNHGVYADEEYMRHDERYDNPFAPAGLHCPDLWERMSWRNGWCASMVSTLLQECTSSTMYYISALARHQIGASNHQNCTYDRCNLLYNEKDYRQEHTSQCQASGHTKCKLIQAPLDEVLNILKAGGIPLFQLHQEELLPSRVEFGTPYVAATHVWSGGLGNPQGNAMNLCQLQELSQLTIRSRSALDHFQPDMSPDQVFPTLWETIMNPFRLLPQTNPTLFWIDTINIPRVDETSVSKQRADDVWSTRTVAIDRMTQTYASADSVIVLDPELRQLNIDWDQRTKDPDSDDADQRLLEIFSSILVSSWMTRCWTYQEGAMGKELLVKLRNQLFPLRFARSDVLVRNRRRLRHSEYGDLHDMLDETSAWFSRLPATRDNDRDIGRRQISEDVEGEPEIFTRIWNEVAARSSTRIVDRLSILSLLVNIRPSEVRRNHPRARLQAILKAQKNLPIALLFQLPLTDHDRNEALAEFDKEEAAERDRGKTLESYVEDPSYPLPSILGSKPLPGQLGWMRQGPPGENFLFFDKELLSAGIRLPSLFKLLSRGIGNRDNYTLHDDSIPCRFNIHLDLAQVHERQKADGLYIITSAGLQAHEAPRMYQTSFPAVLLAQRSPSPSHTMPNDNTPLRNRLFQYICPVACDSFEALDPHSNPSPYRQVSIHREALVENCQYRIHCDFSHVMAPSGHRITGFIPGAITAFDVMSTIMPILVLYYLVCFGFTCIPVFTHSAGAFPKGWLALIAFMFVMRWLFFTWNNTREYRRSTNEILFSEWVNGMGEKETDGATTPTAPVIDSRKRHTGFDINMNLRDTAVFSLLCVMFIVVGAARYKHGSVRWMVAVGGSGLGELLLRWGLETCLPHSRFWGTLEWAGLPELPALRDHYLSPSRLSVWLKSLFGRN